MTSLELYDEVLLEVNDLSSDLFLSKGNFITLYNKEAQRWLAENIAVGKKDHRNYKVQQWLVNDFVVKEKTKSKNSVIYELPDNFYDYVTCKSHAKKGNCSGIIINETIKPSVKEIYLNDEMKKPSFEWEEGIAMVSENTLIVYTTDFSIINTNLTYYKNIDPIDLEGTYKASGNYSKNIDPNYDDVYAREIASRVVKEVYRMYKNQLAFTLANEKTTKDTQS